MRYRLGIIFLIIVCSFYLNEFAFAETSYSLEIDEKIFTVEYQIGADVLAMAIDKEQSSLLVGIENAQDSGVFIKFPNELISAEENQFAVLVNGLEVDYVAESDNEFTSMRFFVPVDSEEIEIIGTRVIPEFPMGVFLLTVGLISTVVILSRISKPLSNHFV